MFKNLLSDMLNGLTSMVQSPAAKSMAAGWLRHAATAGAGYLVTEGVIQHSQGDDFTGAVLFLGAVAWSGLQKYLSNRKLAAAKAAAK